MKLALLDKWLERDTSEIKLMISLHPFDHQEITERIHSFVVSAYSP